MEFRNNCAVNLAVDDWVIFEGNKDKSDEPIWLGRVMSNPEWGGQGVCKNKTRRLKKYPSDVVVGRNEVAVFVMWYEKIDINSDSLDYQISRDIMKPVVQNNRCLIHAGFEMHRMNGKNNPVPKQRTSTRSTKVLGVYSTARRGNQTSHDEWHDKEFELEWKMDMDDRIIALSRFSNES